MDCYSATKRDDILAWATIYMDLEGSVLNEISQEQKRVIMVYFLLFMIPVIMKFMETEIRIEVNNT